MSRNYKFHNPQELYFVSFAVRYWLDVLTRNAYKDAFVESLEYIVDKTTRKIRAGARGLFF